MPVSVVQAGGWNVVLNKGCAMPSPAYKREIGRTHKTTDQTAPASQNRPTAKHINP